MSEDKPIDPIEARRRKLEESMVRRKTQRLSRAKASAPPPEERPRVVVVVRPFVRREESPESLEALMARRLAEARRRLDRLD